MLVNYVGWFCDDVVVYSPKGLAKLIIARLAGPCHVALCSFNGEDGGSLVCMHAL